MKHICMKKNIYYCFLCDVCLVAFIFRFAHPHIVPQLSTFAALTTATSLLLLGFIITSFFLSFFSLPGTLLFSGGNTSPYVDSGHWSSDGIGWMTCKYALT
ncbi:hypothetical protein ACOSQ2_021328 [Xanthoceras sorbifolium]